MNKIKLHMVSPL